MSSLLYDPCRWPLTFLRPLQHITISVVAGREVTWRTAAWDCECVFQLTACGTHGLSGENAASLALPESTTAPAHVMDPTTPDSSVQVPPRTRSNALTATVQVRSATSRHHCMTFAILSAYWWRCCKMHNDGDDGDWFLNHDSDNPTEGDRNVQHCLSPHVPSLLNHILM